MLLLISAALAASCLETGDIQRFTVDIDFTQSVVVERWTVRIPADGCDLEPLPVDLGGARVEEPLVPTDDGARLASVKRVAVLSGSGSGSIRPWRAPAAATVVRFRAPSSVPLQVFTGERAHRHAEGDLLEVWWPRGQTDPPELIWTSWADWVKAGRALEQPIVRSLPSTDAIGTLGRSLRRAELSTLVDRLDTTLDVLPPDDDEPWAVGRSPDEVLATGQGTPSERGRVLLTMLRGAGYDAHPAWFTPDDDPGVPRTLPAPHLLVFPAVAVRQGKEMLYLDPGTTGARPPEVPARMRGGRVLVAGRHLAVPVDTGAPRGEVRIDADVKVDRAGRVTVEAEVFPTGAAEQVLRSKLSGQPAEKWPEIVERWITPRDGIRALVVDVRGLDGLVPFQLDIRFAETRKLEGTGTTLRGPVRDLLAPGLAALLPPGIAIEERLTVRPPDGVLALTAIRPVHPPSEAVLLNRSLAADGNDLLLGSDWRVLGADSPTEALQRLPYDTEVLLFPADASARRAARRLDLPDGDRKVLDAMLLWRLGQPEKARKVLDRLHPKLSVVELAALVGNYVSPGDRRPWEALVQLVDSDEERLAVIDNLIRTGDRRLAWRLAAFMAKHSPDRATRARAFVQVARFQGPEQPDAQADPEGNKAWRDPIKLLEKASSLAADRPELVRLELARAYLRAGTPLKALDLLAEAIGDDPTPLTKAVRAEFGAMTGVYGIDVLGLVDEALEEAPFDPEVREAAGRARALLGRRRQGVADILLSAELAGNDSARWMTAAQLAADFGDLRAALFAGRRASDLAPSGRVQAVRLQLLAKLARNEPALRLAIQRSGGLDLYADTPDDLESLIALAKDQVPQSEYDVEIGRPHPWELALLRHHVGDVETSKRLLAERAELHHARGMAEDAALDGSLLLDRHRAAEGARFLLGGATSRFRHAHPDDLIRSYLSSDDVRSARIDLDLVMGRRPTAAGDRQRRETVNLLRSNPARLALEASTWPVAMRDFDFTAPEGFEENRTLSRIVGVNAYSDPERQMTILVTERSTGALPPPLANLYETGPTVLSTERGATVVRLEGGAIPLYAGITLFDQRDVVGIGLSPSTARDAVLYGIGALERPGAE
jgi:tetratricopeptide (TPR) repeat protein